MSNAIITLNINDMLEPNSRDSMQYCAEKWGCDFIEVTEFPWEGPYMHAACYKTRAFDLCGADRIFIIDADTVMSSATPSPFGLFLPEEFVAVFQKRGWGPNDGIERSEWEKCLQFCRDAHEENIVHSGIVLHESMPYFNSGVMLAERKLHSEAFERAHQICLKQGFTWYDQTPLNFTIRCAGIHVVDGGRDWNHFNPDWENPRDWKRMRSSIYHFAGNPGRKEKIQQVQWKI